MKSGIVGADDPEGAGIVIIAAGINERGVALSITASQQAGFAFSIIAVSSA